MKLELYYNTCFLEEESDTERLSSLPAVTQLFRHRIPTWELSFRGHSLSLGLQKSQTDGKSPGTENRMGLKDTTLAWLSPLLKETPFCNRWSWLQRSRTGHTAGNKWLWGTQLHLRNLQCNFLLLFKLRGNHRWGSRKTVRARGP